MAAEGGAADARTAPYLSRLIAAWLRQLWKSRNTHRRFCSEEGWAAEFRGSLTLKARGSSSEEGPCSGGWSVFIVFVGNLVELEAQPACSLVGRRKSSAVLSALRLSYQFGHHVALTAT